MEILGLILECLITVICFSVFLILSDKLDVQNQKLSNLFTAIKQSGGKVIKWMSIMVGILMLIEFLLHLKMLLN
jgi:predicted Kef-type K+ transport protein